MRNTLNLCATALLLWPIAPCALGETPLSAKIAHAVLNRSEPTVVTVGMKGVTTLEFPFKVEALDGFGFSPTPAPDGPDLFQISFNKGTNFLSLKAMKPGAEGNLSVVLNGKVYCLLCREGDDPSFAVLFEDGAVGRGPTDGAPPKPKAVSPARLLGFLDKVKGFPTLKVSAAEMYRNLEVAEPGSPSVGDGLEMVLKRVIRDDALDTVGFEVELKNGTANDVYYDPEGFSVRVKDEIYAQSVSDAAGLVPAGRTTTAFFAVTGAADGGRNDLAVNNRFDVLLKTVEGDTDPRRSAGTQWQDPPDTLPNADGSPEKNGVQDPGKSAKAKLPGTPNLSPNASPIHRPGKKVAQHEP